MIPTRPLMNESTENLEVLFLRYRNDPIRLKEIADELSQRKTAKVHALLSEVSAALDTTQGVAVSPPPEKKVGFDSKLTNLIDYLNNLAQVTTATVLDFKSYQNILWLETVPRDPAAKCFSRHWGADDNVAEDVWIDVLKMSEPPLPTGLKNFEQWVDDGTLQNVDGNPVLKESIVVTIPKADPETGTPVDTIEKRFLIDHPEIKTAFDIWVEQKWHNWAVVRRRWNEVQKAYGALFAIYQEQQRLGEQYELVLGLGLLTWKPEPNLPPVCRHLVTGKASLEYDASNGHFTVRVAADGDQAELELDMIDASAYPPNASILRETAVALRDNIWDRAQIDAVLAAVANSLEKQGKGDYEPQSNTPSGRMAGLTPLIEFAPALILRKRSIKGLVGILADMRRHIEAGVDLPVPFLELCEAAPVDTSSVELPTEDDSDCFGELDVSGRMPEPIYFPLASNPQQRTIVRKLGAKHGVLVQGPPGTGKSTTIVNLVCHLLATGKRVLVTAKTPRALESLHDKIPHDVAPLCISMLGTSVTDERLSLAKSVEGILNHDNNRNVSRDKKRVAEVEVQLAANLEKRAALKKQIISLRERETYQHNIVDNTYAGTAAAIATRVRDEAAIFSWFADTLTEDDAFPLTSAELARLKRLVADISIDAEVELTKYFPVVGKDVPEPEILRNDWAVSSELRAFIELDKRFLDCTDGVALMSMPEERTTAILNELEKLLAGTASVLNRPLPWLSHCVRDILNDIDRPWREVYRLTTDRMRLLKAQAEKVKGYNVEIPNPTDRRRLAADARALRNHYTAGKSLKRMFFFQDPVVQKHCGIVRSCYVNGKHCLDPDALTMLIDYLSAELAISEVWTYWQGKVDHKPSHHFIVEVAIVEEHLEALEHALSLYDLRGECIKVIDVVAGLARPHWGEPAAVQGLAKTCRVVQAKAKLDTIESRLHMAEGQVAAAAAKPNSHPLCEDLLVTVRAADSDAYHKVAEEIRVLARRFEGVIDKRDLLTRLAVKAPILTSFITSNRDADSVGERLDKLESAWAWRRALAWLEGLESVDDASLDRSYRRLEDTFLKDLAEIVSLKAWGYCLDRMDPVRQAHLQAWQLAMRRIGRGTGKRTHSNRMDAQRHLNVCKAAVPAWIMPLHRVYETLEGTPKAFDVIIIDEASQAGYEALPLMYLGEKLIVVGDDMQISPENPGIGVNIVPNLIKTHLNHFELRDTFGMESSLFAHASVRFGNRIVLREHFRCAPEIIRFSDKLCCYQANPLIPLKQCPPNRLEPLRAVHVAGGYRQGAGNSVINRPEAEALVAQVKECVKNPRYAGLTMGVISLQQNGQANLIESLLVKAIGVEEMQERRLVCGNPYSFQGDERDVVFLSLVAAEGETRFVALTTDNDMRRFNVAASRAKEQLWLFHSVTLNDLSAACYRHKLLSHFLNPGSPDITGFDFDDLKSTAYRANRTMEDPPRPFDSWFEIDVALDIAGRGYTVVPQFKFGEYRIDLVIQGGNSMLAVECDGEHWHGPDALDNDFKRQRDLQRYGWVFFRLRDSAYRVDREKALAGLWPLLEERGIFPNGYQQATPKQNKEGCTEGINDVVETDSHVDFDDEADELDLMIAEEHEEHEGSKVEDGEGQSGLFESCRVEGCPKSVQEMLALRPLELRRLIFSAVQAKSGRTCVREHVGTLVLKACKVRTSGQPRQQFMRKVEGQVAVMIRDGSLVPYKSKNNRLRLGWKTPD